MYLPSSVLEQLSDSPGKHFVGDGHERPRSVEEGIRRRTQEPANRESGRSEDAAGRRRRVHRAFVPAQRLVLHLGVPRRDGGFDRLGVAREAPCVVVPVGMLPNGEEPDAEIASTATGTCGAVGAEDVVLPCLVAYASRPPGSLVTFTCLIGIGAVRLGEPHGGRGPVAGDQSAGHGPGTVAGGRGVVSRFLDEAESSRLCAPIA
ncbi:hypothetical protein HMPREF1486_01952 [Streptomyces sp. HPH0547]|nr:hypothetical protein HMPREF1486_01952 [Streptomyces sp. HPH0547]